MDRETTQPEVELSVVIPVKDEEANIAPLAAEIDAALAGLECSWEVVWVDDGSRDASAVRLRELDRPHRYLILDRNHGQSAAYAAGFRAARGEWVATLDGDGQNDPADLPRQLAHAHARRVDMVNGIRTGRCDSRARRVASAIGNGFRACLTGRGVSDVGCSTRVVRRAAVLEVPFFHGMHRFLPTLVRMRGYAIDEIPVNHRPRRAGRSKYGIWKRMWWGLRDCFGVRWLQRRNRNWRVGEEGGGDPG